ncbi:hypothetical protein HPB49_017331 [Dermacentor silvarum]|uniref:Uncharacterized protein n=1 Tax=Dermacentor silvarum TaxID=543639 RepID=A0ACB8DQE8_DERSI|nr:solute carrier family 35 member G1 [Dermacentor silvarum]KAH7974608.1 hypothetical protein HPB49_017331 [Dermacentor silvarum]
MTTSWSSPDLQPLLPPADDEAINQEGFEPTACDGELCASRVGDEDDQNARTTSGPHPWQLYKGLAFCTLSSFCFSICTVIVKRLNYIPAAELAAVRGLGILVFTAPLLVLSREPPLGPSDLRALLVLRGLLGATNLCLSFYAVQHMPMADATAIVFSVPVFVPPMARLFLGESCGLSHGAAVLLTLTGIALITRPPLLFGGDAQQAGPAQTRGGVAAALVSTAFGASVYIVLRKLKHVHHWVVMFSFGWVAVLETGAFTLLTSGAQLQLPRCDYSVDRWLLVALGALSFGGQALVTLALKSEQAGPVSLIRSATNIVLVFAWQVAFFGELPDRYTVSGAVLVTGSVLLTGLRKWALAFPESSVTRSRLAWFVG